MTPLTHPEVRLGTVDADVKYLIIEYLTRWFNGQTHDLPAPSATGQPGGVRSVAFPWARFVAGPDLPEGPLPVASDGTQANPALAVVVDVRWGGKYAWRPGDATRHEQRLGQVNLYARTAASDTRALIQQGTDLLHAVLVHPALTLPLAVKGIRLGGVRPPISLPSAEYHVMFITATADVAVPLADTTGT